jgi:hypothetical protein
VQLGHGVAGPDDRSAILDAPRGTGFSQLSDDASIERERILDDRIVGSGEGERAQMGGVLHGILAPNQAEVAEALQVVAQWGSA